MAPKGRPRKAPKGPEGSKRMHQKDPKGSERFHRGSKRTPQDCPHAPSGQRCMGIRSEMIINADNLCRDNLDSHVYFWFVLTFFSLGQPMDFV